MVGNFLLKGTLISALNCVLFVSKILRKSSWENDDAKVESSFVIDAVVDVSLGSVMCLVDCFSFLCSITGNDVSFSMSYEARMWRVYAFCGGCINWMVEGVVSFCRATS